VSGAETCHPVEVAIATVVYSDERLFVVNKPAGVSLATARSNPQAAVERLFALLPADTRALLASQAPDLGLVHRLDVGTSGLVVLSLDQEAHRALVTAFSTRAVGKSYLALVWGHPRPPQGEWRWPLGPDRRDRRRMRADSEGRQAETSYRVVARAPHIALVRLEPRTGRTHQLRVHLAHAGHPIVGDDLYGGPRHRAVRDPRLRHVLAPNHPFLHAWRLHLPATESTREVILHAPLPPDFRAALSAHGLTCPDPE
jgi:23S rRNA pseudouridine1911/1915/1917 synthase